MQMSQATSRRHEVCSVIYIPWLARLLACPLFPYSVAVYISEDITEFCA
jgi:hypothetical protein